MRRFLRSRGKVPSAIILIVMLFMNIMVLDGCQKNDKGLKVGANLSLTGSSPYWSTQIKRGLEVAADESNADNPADKLTVLYEDNQGQAKNAIAIAQKLATMDKVAVMVTAHTPMAQPQQPLVAQYKIPLLATVVSAVGFGKVNDYSFLDWPSHEELTPPVAAYAARDLKAKTAITIVVNDEYGKDGAEVFKKEFEKAGGSVLAEETFGNADKDMRAQLTKLLKTSPDVMYTVAREDALVAVVKQARELGFKGYVVGVNAFDSPNVWKGLGELGEGIVFGGVTGHAGSGPDAATFDAAYEKKFSEKPDWVSLYGYTIGKYLFPIVIQAKGDPDKIREALSMLKAPSLRGDLVMSKERKVLSKGIVYIRKGGQNVVVSGK
jgi:branched-chain amino acid transport system substrate-binding protein